MITFTNQLYEELSRELEAFSPADDETGVAAQKLETSLRYMERLKSFINTYTFSDPKEEIIFFKKIKHKFYVPTIFYSELLYIHSNMPSGDRKVIINFYRQVIENNNKYIERNRILFTYHKTGRTSDDELMFLRNSDCHPLLLEYHGDIDTSFCTISSSVLSKLLAFEQVNNYLSEQIEKLKFGSNITGQEITEPPQTNRKIKYLGKKAGLHEVLIAMHANGDFGDVPLNWVMEAFEETLGMSLGNYYSSLIDLAMRKKSKTPYLSTLVTVLERVLEKKREAL